MSRFSKTLIILLLLLCAGHYWLLVNAGPDAAHAKSFDLGELRKQANALPGKKPTALEYTTIATRELPGAVLAAGTGLRMVQSGVIVWRATTPRGDIVIDSGLSQTDAQKLEFSHYDSAAASLASTWMKQARLILFTHEHIDHVGGFLDEPAFNAIAGKAVLSPELARGMTAHWRSNGGQLPPPRRMAAIEAVAPGVVLVQTPGHTPASQMIFIRLENGREYLFTGDTGSLASNILQTVPRSRLLTDWLVQEDRAATLGWLKGLRALREQNPQLVIIPSHDPEFLGNSAAQGGFTKAALPRPLPLAR